MSKLNKYARTSRSIQGHKRAITRSAKSGNSRHMDAVKVNYHTAAIDRTRTVKRKLRPYERDHLYADALVNTPYRPPVFSIWGNSLFDD